MTFFLSVTHLSEQRTSGPKAPRFGQIQRNNVNIKRGAGSLQNINVGPNFDTEKFHL